MGFRISGADISEFDARRPQFKERSSGL